MTIEEESGNIALCDESDVFIYTPSGRDYGDLRWTKTFELDCSTECPLKSLSWGSPDELLVAGETISLWSVANHDNPQVIWTSTLSSSVALAYFSPDAGLIASFGDCDRMVKIWRRLSYEQDSTRFDVSYLSHPSTVTDLHWRRVWHQEQNIDNLLYTCCADRQVRVWSHSDHHASSLMQMISSIDANESIQPRRLSMGSVSKNRFTFILHSRDLARAAERALQTSRQSSGHALEHLIEIANRSPEICVVLDGLGHMSAWGLENAGYKNKQSAEKFNVALVDGVNITLPSTSSAEDLVRIQAFANNDISASLCVLVHSYSGQIDWYQGSFTEFFDTAARQDRLRLQSSWSGHASSIDKVVASPDYTHFISWTDTNRAIVWSQSTTGALIRKSRLKIEKEIIDAVILNKQSTAIILLDHALEIWDVRVLSATKTQTIEIVHEDILALVVLDGGHSTSSEVVIGIVGKDYSIHTYRLHLPVHSTTVGNGYHDRLTRLGTKALRSVKEMGKTCNYALAVFTNQEGSTKSLIVDQCGVLQMYSNSLSKTSTTIAPAATFETYIQPSKRLSACRGFAALVHENLRTLSIWNLRAQCYEFVHTFPGSDEVYGLSWHTLRDGLSFLAVRSAYNVFILSQRRYSIDSDRNTWAFHGTIRIREHSSNMIGSFCWIADCRIVLSAGDQILAFDIDTNTSGPDVNATGLNQMPLITAIQDITINNSCLPIFHPAMISSFLPSDRSSVIETIFGALRSELRFAIEGDVISSDLRLGLATVVHDARRDDFTVDDPNSDPDHEFDEETSTSLQEAIRKISRGQLSESCAQRLCYLVNIFTQMQDSRTSMDKFALTYLQEFLLSALTLQAGDTELSPIPYRAIAAASLSKTQEALVHFVLSYLDKYNVKLTWSTARSLGIFLFLKPSSSDDQSLQSYFETVARNEYNRDADDRNPVNCSLHYLALNKKAIIQSLWRTTLGIKEKESTMKLLAHDFTQQKWKATALKNAYALLSRRRFEYAAALFLLGGSLPDACNVCVNQSHDIQLAIAIARVWTGNKAVQEEVLQSLLERSILDLAIDSPQARWMAIWGAIHQGNYKRAVQSIVWSVDELLREQFVARQENEPGTERKNEPFKALSWQANESKGLVEIYLHLRSEIVKAGEWTVNVVTARQEWEFVMRCVNWYCRSGMQLLALDLVANWTFVAWQTESDHVRTKADVQEGTKSSADVEEKSILDSWADDPSIGSRKRRESVRPAQAPSKAEMKSKPPPTQFVEPSVDSLLDSFGF